MPTFCCPRFFPKTKHSFSYLIHLNIAIHIFYFACHSTHLLTNWTGRIHVGSFQSTTTRKFDQFPLHPSPARSLAPYTRSRRAIHRRRQKLSRSASFCRLWWPNSCHSPCLQSLHRVLMLGKQRPSHPLRQRTQCATPKNLACNCPDSIEKLSHGQTRDQRPPCQSHPRADG